MKQAQFHCHTIFSNNKTCLFGTESLTTPKQLMRVAKEKNILAIAITDHNTMDGYRDALPYAKECGITLIPAMEINTDELGQILAYGITTPISHGLAPQRVIQLIHEQNGIAIIAHPFDVLRKMHSLNQVYALADGVEITNYGATGNARAKAFAEMNHIHIRTGSADAHTSKLLDAVTMDFKDACNTANDYLSALRDNDFVISAHMSYYRAIYIGLLNVIHTRV